MPAYRVKWLDQIHCATMIQALSAVDCGEALRLEWTARKARLRESPATTGAYYAYMLHGRYPALAEPWGS